MVTKEAIDAALNAHAKWKTRLEDAVATGKSEFKPVTVSRDDACDFGQWLYALKGDDIKTPHFANVKTLHADFHTAAGKILDLALSGKAAEAKQSLQFGGEYMRITGKLVLALNSWKESIT